MLAVAANVVVIVVIAAAVINAIAIVPIAVIVRAFVLRHPIVLSLCRLVVAHCFASFAGIFVANLSFG
jgi:hypothetical protein